MQVNQASKVGILTLTQSENYGTVLQAMATQRLFALASPEIDFELIPTDVRRVRTRRIMSLVNPRNMSFGLRRARNFMSMRHFVEPYMNGHRRYVNIADQRGASEYLQTRYGSLITGSDEVWNLANVGSESVYFVPTEFGGYRASFATSANRLNREALTEADEKKLGESLARYDYLSVRDTNTDNLVRTLTGGKRAPTEIIDPTLLYDFPEAEGLDFALPGTRKTKLLLMVRDPQLAAGVVRRLGDRFEIYSVFVKHQSSEYLRLSPLEFTKAFGQYDVVVTDFFHGTCMSIKNQANFLSIDREASYLEYESKIANITTKLGVSDRYLNLAQVPTDEAVAIVVERVHQSLSGEILPVDVEKAIARERDVAKTVIAEIVSGIHSRVSNG